MRPLAAVAEMEMLRLLRRDVPFVLVLLAAAPLLLLALPWFGHRGYLQDVADPVQRAYSIGQVYAFDPTWARQFVDVVGPVALAVLGYVLAAWTLLRDLRSGAWRLLRTCGARELHLILARAAGVALALAVLWCLLQLVVAGTIPFTPRPGWAILVHALVAWALAATFIVDGLAEGRARHAGGPMYMKVRVSSLLRVAAPILVLLACLPGSWKTRVPALFDCLAALMQGAPIEHVARSWDSPVLMLILVAAVQVGGAAVVAACFLRDEVDA